MSEHIGAALETAQLSRRYGRSWALRDCSFTLPVGRVAALVGPNGAGKTTLLHLAVGLLSPTNGSVRVFGAEPYEQPRAVLPRIGFVAQDHPLYASFTVADMLTFGRKLNPGWNQDLALRRINRLGIALDKRVGKLSGGQKAQIALALALAKRPGLVLLDEPLASLDPLARREFLRALTEAVEEDGLTVLLSSHIIGDLERVCDYLIILSASQVQLAGEIADILRTHRILTGPRQAADTLAGRFAVVEQSLSRSEAELLVRGEPPFDIPGWQAHDASLEVIVLAYLGQSAASSRSDALAVSTAEEWEAAR
ncbi:MAG: ABC transporter ATP-binding protein [Ktedonobacterales bacterium]